MRLRVGPGATPPPLTSCSGRGCGPAARVDVDVDHRSDGVVDHELRLRRGGQHHRPDAAGGNQTLTWTEHNRLGTVTTPAGDTSYVYDADGNLLIRRDPGKVTLFLPTQEIARDTASGTLTGTRYYSHNGTVVALRVGGANISYLQADLHGTAQVAVKAEAIDNHVVTRRSFDPYGNPVGAGQGTWPDSCGFLNKPHNQVTGLTDIGARTYDPVTGRFISVDPLLNPKDPQSWTGYTYANNNPTTHADPSGEFCDGCEYGGSGDHHGVGYSADGWCGCRTEEQVKNDWDVINGYNKDPKKQPVLPGRRVPTFDELKKLPGFAHYMQSGTYEDAVIEWAQNICAHQSSAVDNEFCTVADSYGLLGDKTGNMAMLKLLVGGVVGGMVGFACTALSLGIGTIGCGIAAGAVGGAAANSLDGGSPLEGAVEGALFGIIPGGRLLSGAKSGTATISGGFTRFHRNKTR